MLVLMGGRGVLWKLKWHTNLGEHTNTVVKYKTGGTLFKIKDFTIGYNRAVARNLVVRGQGGAIENTFIIKSFYLLIRKFWLGFT